MRNPIRPARLWKIALLALVLAVYGLAGLSVVRLEGIPRLVRNGAVSEEGSLRLPAAGVGYTAGPPDWLEAVVRNSSIEVEMEVRPFRARQAGPARIFTISRGTSLRNLTFGQEGADLIIRLRAPGRSLNGEPAYTVPGVLGDGQFHDIRVAIAGDRFQADVDGQEVLRDTLAGNSLGGWDPGFRLLLGNEVGGQRPWLGEIRRATVRVGGKTFEYAEKGALTIPGHYWAMGPAPRPTEPDPGARAGRAAGTQGGEGLSDWVVNFLGFLPLGGLLVLMWRRFTVVGAVFLCLLVSLFLEAGQFFVAGRDPHLCDLLMNTLGGLAGALLGKALSFLGPSSRPQVNRPTS